jgi:hypothetical protein
MSCQIRVMSNGFLPMRRAAQGAIVSSVPPSPIPVIPMSVSMATTMLLCSSGIWSGMTLGPWYKRTWVIRAAGRAAAAARSGAAVRSPGSPGSIDPRTDKGETRAPTCPSAEGLGKCSAIHARTFLKNAGIIDSRVTRFLREFRRQIKPNPFSSPANRGVKLRGSLNDGAVLVDYRGQRVVVMPGSKH